MTHPIAYSPVKTKTSLSGSTVTTGLERRIVVKDNNDCVFLNLDDILFMEAKGAYTNIHTLNQAPFLISKNIKAFEDKLSKSEFIRTHKSYIVNAKHISRYNRRSSYSIILSSGTEIPVATRRKELLDNLIMGVLI